MKARKRWQKKKKTMRLREEWNNFNIIGIFESKKSTFLYL